MKTVLDELRSWSIVLFVLIFALALVLVLERFDLTWTKIPPQSSVVILPTGPLPARPVSPIQMPPVTVPYPAPIIPIPSR